MPYHIAVPNKPETRNQKLHAITKGLPTMKRTIRRSLCIMSILFFVLSTSLGISNAQNPATTLDFATYLGTGGSDNEAVAVGITPDKEIIVAVNIGNQGKVQRYNSNASTLLSSMDAGGVIQDMDVNRVNGDIAIVGDSGLKVFDATVSTEYPARSQPLASGNKRVAIGSDGRIVTSVGDSVTLWSASGEVLSTATTEDMSGKQDRHIYDVAISAEQGYVYVGGYRQASSNYQSPFLYAFANNDLTSYTWRTYDYWQSLVDAAQPYQLTADSRLSRIEIGRDGKLYILGEAHGGTTVFKTDGTVPASQKGEDLQYIQPVEIDNWNKMHDTNSAVKAFFGEVDPTSGQVLRGQFILPRWDKDGVAGAGSSTRNYRVKNGSLAVDEDGTVYVGASAGKYIKGRYEGTLTINGEPVGEMIADDFAKEQGISNNEMALYVVDSSFANRQTWTVFTRDRSNGTISGLAAAYGITTFVGSSSYGELFTTVQDNGSSAYNGTNSELNDAYFAVLQGKQPEPETTPPEVGDIPDQRIVTGSSFASIKLNNYVKDADSEPGDMTWSYSGTREMSVTLEQTGDGWVATVGVPEVVGWTGEETITFTATDADGLSDSDAATFTVTANQPPQARDDSTITTREQPVTINILANDHDPDGNLNPQSITVATYSEAAPGNPYAPGDQFAPPDPRDPNAPPNGIVTISDGTLIYSPTGTFTGTRTFTYTVRDDHSLLSTIHGDQPADYLNGALSNEATVTIIIKANEKDNRFLQENTPYTTTVGEALPIVVTEEVSNADLATLKVIGQPVHGTASMDSGSDTITYIPDQGYVGDDTFVYMLRDTSGVLWYITANVTVEAQREDYDDGRILFLPLLSK